MNIADKHYRTIWLNTDDSTVVQVIDQNKLPFVFEIMDLRTVDEVCVAITEMHIRGAGLIGATAGYGMYLAALTAPREGFDEYLTAAARRLIATRPTAKNLEWAVLRQLEAITVAGSIQEKVAIARATAQCIADEDAEFCRRIGEHGLRLIQAIYREKRQPVNILTHCNAGWLAFVDYGSATAPIYAAHAAGIPVHVWVDETRPRNQGANLTLWELQQHGVPCTLIVDNCGGHLMQHGLVDLVIVGTDRTTCTGDVANKIGTYLKALAAKDNNIPFYVALPSSTFDWECRDGVRDIPIEERNAREVLNISGWHEDRVVEIALCPPGARAANYGFDVTPARLISGLITERGICAADEESILGLYPERRAVKRIDS